MLEISDLMNGRVVAEIHEQEQELNPSLVEMVGDFFWKGYGLRINYEVQFKALDCKYAKWRNERYCRE